MAPASEDTASAVTPARVSVSTIESRVSGSAQQTSAREPTASFGASDVFAGDHRNRELQVGAELRPVAQRAL